MTSAGGEAFFGFGTNAPQIVSEVERALAALGASLQGAEGKLAQFQSRFGSAAAGTTAAEIRSAGAAYQTQAAEVARLISQLQRLAEARARVVAGGGGSLNLGAGARPALGLPGGGRTSLSEIDSATKTYAESLRRANKNVLTASDDLTKTTKNLARNTPGVATAASATAQEKAATAAQRNTDRESAASQRKIDSQVRAAQAEERVTAKANQNFGQAYASNLFGRGMSGGSAPQSIKEAVGNLGASAGTLSRYAAEYAAINLITKSLHEELTAYLDYKDSVTDLNVAFGAGAQTGQQYVQALEQINRFSGGNVGAALDSAARGVRAFGEAGKGATQGAQDTGLAVAYASEQLAVITDVTLPEATASIIAVGKAFDLTAENLTQVTDAISNAKKMGGAPGEISKFLEGTAESAAQAGIGLNKLAATGSTIIAQTGESGQAAGTRFSKVLGIIGGSTGQNVLRSLGIDTTGLSISEQIDVLAGKYQTLGRAQQAQIRQQLGGTANIRELIPLLTRQKEIADATKDPSKITGAGTKEFQRRVDNLNGTLKQLSSNFKSLEVNLANTGIFDGIGLALKAMEPALRIVSNLVGLYDNLNRTLRSGLGLLLELGLAYKAFTLVKDKGGFAAVLGTGVQKIRETGNPALAAENATVIASNKATATARVEAEAAEAQTVRAATVARGEAEAAEIEVITVGYRTMGSVIASINATLARAAVSLTATGKGLALGGEKAVAAQALAVPYSPGRTNLGASALGIAGMAAAAAYTAYSIFQDEKRINAGADSAQKYLDQGLRGTGTSADDEKAAATLRTNAKNYRTANEGYLSRFLNGPEGDPVGKLATAEEAQAKRYVALGKRIDAINQEVVHSHSFADLSSLLDASSTDNLGKSLKFMTDQGRNATSQLLALEGALDKLGTGARVLSTADKEKFAANLGVTAADQLGIEAGRIKRDRNIGDNVSPTGTGLGTTGLQAIDRHLPQFLQNLGKGPSLQRYDDAVKKLNDPRLASKISGDVTKAAKAFTDAGGDVLDPLQKKTLISAVRAVYDRDLPKSFKGKERKAILDGATAAYAASVKLMTPDDPNADLQTLIIAGPAAAAAHAARKGSEAALNARSIYDPTAGTASTTEHLAKLEEYRAKAVRAGEKAKDSAADMKARLETFDDAIVQARLDVMANALQTIDALGAFNQSALSPFDPGGRLDEAIRTVEAQLVKDPGNIALATKKNDLLNAKIAQNLTDRQAQITTLIDPRDTVATANAAVDAAQAALDGATGPRNGADFLNKQKATTDARNAAMQAQIDLDNALASATVRPGDATATARVALESAARTLQGQIPGTQGYAQAYTAFWTAWEAKIQTAVDEARIAGDAAVAPGDTVGAAKQALDDAISQASVNRPGSQGIADQYAIRDKRIALAKTQIDLANANRNAAVFPGDPLGAAKVALTNAAASLSVEQVGTLGYAQALLAFRSAQVAMAAAARDAADIARQLGGDVTDPLVAARDAVLKAAQKLRDDRRAHAPASVLNIDALDLKKTQAAAEQTAFQQNLSAMQTKDQLQQITHATYLRYLQSEHNRLTAITKRTYQQQQDLNTIDLALQSANAQLAGQFNIGDIKVPTPYEVRRSIASTLAGTNYQGGSITNQISINGADLVEVKRLLTNLLGPNATSRTGTSTRKI